MPQRSSQLDVFVWKDVEEAEYAVNLSLVLIDKSSFPDYYIRITMDHFNTNQLVDALCSPKKNLAKVLRDEKSPAQGFVGAESLKNWNTQMEFFSKILGVIFR